MITAGIEGGSADAVEERWTIPRFAAIRQHWARHGPPTHIAVAIFASAWGVKLTSEPERDSPREIPTAGVVGPSIAELASLLHVQPGCDPFEASKLIAQRVLGG